MTCRRGKGRKVQGSRALEALRLDGHREARARRARAACSRVQESLGQLLQQALRGNTTCACPPFLALVAPSRGSAANGHYGRFGAACERVMAMRSRQACSRRGNRRVHSVQPGLGPVNGACGTSPGASSICIPDNASSPTRCTECKSEAHIFLLYGGCYTIVASPEGNVGSYICSQASGGKGTECNTTGLGKYVSTNPDGTADERRILCSGAVGLGIQGASGCSDCIPPVNNKVGIALCFTCNTVESAPVDYQCRPKEPTIV